MIGIPRSFELGAADYVIRPVPSDVLVAKVQKLFDARSTRARSGVAGSLTEMGLPDIVQILAQGRKSGRLKVSASGENGEIHFDQGQVVNAMWGRLRGEDAFYAMCPLTSGEFALDPTFKAGQRVIQASPESLLLEGMRRSDEAGRCSPTPPRLTSLPHPSPQHASLPSEQGHVDRTEVQRVRSRRHASRRPWSAAELRRTPLAPPVDRSAPTPRRSSPPRARSASSRRR